MANQEITPIQRTIAVCTEIEQERLHQINRHGFDAAHDDAYGGKPTLLRAALIYASRTTYSDDDNKATPPGWPWASDWWRPNGRRRMLIKACALLVAHIETLDREAEREAAQVEDDAGVVGED